MARSMALIDRERLKIQEGTLENVAESTAAQSVMGTGFAELRTKKKA
jgi:hypothetical protein